MRSRRGAVSTCWVAACATAFAYVALLDGCGEFSVAGDTSDAAAPPADAMNGGIEGAAGDATTPGDAGGAAAPDAACGAHYFCADFEETQPAAGWAGVEMGFGGAVAIAAGAGLPGNALRSTLPATTAAKATAYAYVVQPFAGAVGLHVELEINAPLDSLAPAGDVTILEVSSETAGVSTGVDVVLRSTSPSLGFYVAKGDGTSQTPTAQIDLPRGRWAHVALDFRFGSAGFLRLMVDGTTALDEAVVTGLPATPELRVGLQHYNGASPSFSALFDTVRADLLQ